MTSKPIWLKAWTTGFSFRQLLAPSSWSFAQHLNGAICLTNISTSSTTIMAKISETISNTCNTYTRYTMRTSTELTRNSRRTTTMLEKCTKKAMKSITSHLKDHRRISDLPAEERKVEFHTKVFCSKIVTALPGCSKADYRQLKAIDQCFCFIFVK